uniref:Lipocalin/cytosolic fatty-acid binding domain-containing protein n=1 Tax=Microcebus murinus TaxID=30608 RepID=A0A8C5YA29_MICMU|nr:odorant-binding protein 2b-like [Microcebus murinus]
MKALLLTAVLGLVAALSLAQEEQDFSGTWYVKAVVMGRDMPEEMRSKQMSPVRVTALEGGDLEVTITFVKNNQCVQKKVLMQKTDEPGKFRTYDGKKLLYAQELPGTGHFVFYCDNRHQGKLFHMARLLGRDSATNVEALEEFKRFVQGKGFLEEDIFTPAQTENCIPERH